MLTGRVFGAVNAFVFQGGEERFSHGVVVADPGAAYGLPDTEGGQCCGELAGCVIAATVGMEYCLRGDRVVV
jgi:hypothetical protein